MAMSQAETLARETLAAMETGEALDYLLSVLGGMVRRTPANLVALRESIAEKLVEAGRLVS
jgi:hypothetical protein